jgi:hypothetical protein
MKKIMIALAVLMVSVSVIAQEPVTNKTRAEKKAERKELREKRRKELAVTTEGAISSGNFVLKANQLRDRYGRMMMVNPSMNFVAKRGNDGFVQFGAETGIGYNGAGGVTLRGTITSYKMVRNTKHNGYNIIFTVNGTFGTITVNVSSNDTGEMANARVQTTWGNQLSFSGAIVPVLYSEKTATDNNK